MADYFYLQVIDELMNYLDSNLLTLNINLLRINFERILASIWLELMKEISEILLNTDPVWFIYSIGSILTYLQICLILSV